LKILGIETSCDETAAAIVEPDGEGGRILSNIVHSQIDAHAAYGGVVPEIAARAHVRLIDHIVGRAMADADLSFADLDGVAATAGPGLVGGLIVGLMTGKAIAAAASKPFIAVNHLEAHALTARMTDGLAFPYLLLLVSGGHSQILLVRGVGAYERLATTIDDALGEAFDKTAKMLGLEYPGGPQVEVWAEKGDSARFDLPRPLSDRKTMDMSFAGLKTAVRIAAQRIAPVSENDIADICASFQLAICDIVDRRIKLAVTAMRERGLHQVPVVAAGGVAANKGLRGRLQQRADEMGFDLVIPPPALCADNGAMVAWAGLERLRCGQSDPMDSGPRSRWPLDETAEPAIGAGKQGVKV